MEEETTSINEPLTRKQIKAIKLVRHIAERLQREFPETIDDYRAGMFLPEIVEKYNLVEIYRVKKELMSNALGVAFRGMNGFLDISSLEGLISKEEADLLESAHKSESGKLVTFLGLGVHGMSAEERTAVAKRNERLGKGLFGLSPEEKKAASRKSGLKFAVNKGWRIWLIEEEGSLIPGEKECAYLLSQMPEYKKSSLARLEKIAEKLNELYHGGEPFRDAAQVNGALTSFKKYNDIPMRRNVPLVEAEKESLIPGEIECAYLLSQMPEYKRGKYLDMKKIAEKLNELYHGGESVRHNKKIRAELQKYRKEKGISEAKPLDWFEAESDSIIPGEVECAYYLSKLDEFQIKGKVKLRKLTKKLNELYHSGEEIRTPPSVTAKLQKYKQQIGDIDKTFQRTSWKTKGVEGDLMLTEEQFVYFISQQPEYQHQRSRYKGKADIERIAEEANKLYHNGEIIRDNGQVRNTLARMKRKMKSKGF